MTQTAETGTPLTIIAKLKARPGKEQEVYDACHALLAPTLAEEGCLNYDMHRSSEDPGVLCRGQNSVNPVWDGSLTFVKATEMSTPLGCFYDERTPGQPQSRAGRLRGCIPLMTSKRTFLA